MAVHNMIKCSGRSQVRTWMNAIRAKETNRQRDKINLIPSENLAFPEVIEAVGSDLCNKNSEGYPGKRHHVGNEVMDEVENTAISLAKEVFQVPFANVQPHSGSIANLSVYMALMEKKEDNFMRLHLYDGGHLSHGWKDDISYKMWQSISYRVNPHTGLLDMDEIRDLALTKKPKLIWCGSTAYSKTIPFREFGRIADESKSYLAADISHIAGLVVGKAHLSPNSFVDILTTTTHKTLRGPRGAMIMVTEKGLKKDPDLGNKINSAVFPTLQGGPHMETIFGIATMLHLVSGPSFQLYSTQIVRNAQALAKKFEEMGLEILSKGTDNHQMLLDLSSFGKGRGVFVQMALESVGILCNKSIVPGDLFYPLYPSGICVGTPTLTSRGAKEEDMVNLAKIIRSVISRTMYILDGDEEMKKFPNIKKMTKGERDTILIKFESKLKNRFTSSESQIEMFLRKLD